MTKAAEPHANADGPVTVELVKEIPVMSEMVKTIIFRKPTGEDIIRVGNPVEFDPVSDPPRVRHDMQRMVQMMARLTGFPSSSFGHMDPNDLITCAWAISPFFMPMRGRG